MSLDTGDCDGSGGTQVIPPLIPFLDRHAPKIYRRRQAPAVKIRCAPPISKGYLENRA
jgi:hypothetical protein